MSWTKINHSGNSQYIECSSCEHQFTKKEICFKKSFPLKREVFMGFTLPQEFLTEIVCEKCFDRRKLKMGKDKSRPVKKSK